MPYTLMKGLAWILIAVLLGIVIGWLLRSVAAKRQVERARAATRGTTDQTELEQLRARVADLQPVVEERDRLRAELETERRAHAGSPTAALPPVDEPSGEPNDRSAADAAAILGRSVRVDDLTVVEGIGPAIAELCAGIGITTWAELSVTEVSLLRTMLSDAGPGFASHDPTTWPQQARLLAAGSWDEFVAFTGRLEGGRPAE